MSEKSKRRSPRTPLEMVKEHLPKLPIEDLFAVAGDLAGKSPRTAVALQALLQEAIDELRVGQSASRALDEDLPSR
jgi:hypothetical protein